MFQLSLAWKAEIILTEIFDILSKQISSPPNFRQHVTLLDGRKILIRPSAYDDKAEIAALFNRLSNETRFLRYHYYKATLSQDELESFCNVDYYDTFALVAEIRRNKRDEIVGAAHYFRLSQPDTAEVSFVVEDKEQGNGIGTNLLKILSIMAVERGITTFVAELLNENVVMLNIFRRYNPDLDQVVDGNTKYVAFSLRTT